MIKIPGLIDLQINGYKGIDFSDPQIEEEDIIKAFGEILDSCCSAFFPTIITSPESTYKRNLGLISKVIEMPRFKGMVPGIHAEGPFISPETGACGVHKKEWIRKPDIGFLDKLIEWSNGKIRLLTIAAETEGSGKLTGHAVKKGITVSLGHELALDKDMEKAVKAGAKALTHLGNGIPNLINRHHNSIWAGLANDELYAMLITDGHHLPHSLIKTVIKAKGVSKCIVTSDSAPLAGMPPGKYVYNGEEVSLEENGLLHNIGRGYLAGSSSSMIQCMNYLASLDFLDTGGLLKIGFYNPLELIGVSPESIKNPRQFYFDEISRIFSIES